MMKFRRCAGGPVTWIGTTSGFGSGCGAGGPCALAGAHGMAARMPSTSAAVFAPRHIETTPPRTLAERPLRGSHAPTPQTTDGTAGHGRQSTAEAAALQAVEDEVEPV